MLKVGVQGDAGSACDAAASAIMERGNKPFSLEYLIDANRVLYALSAKKIDLAILAIESPIGTPIPETVSALKFCPNIIEVSELTSEVRHCIMSLPGQAIESVGTIASHEIPLLKHRHFLKETFPNYKEVPLPDTGFAASELSLGHLPDGTAVIALPHSANLYDLTVLIKDLPANDNYLTRFVCVRLASRNP